MNKCKKCKVEDLTTYYVEYCQKCDIQNMIYEKPKAPAVVFFPVKNYGLKYVPEFTEKVARKLWLGMCESGLNNDSYFTLYFDDDNESHVIFKKVLDELNIKYSDELFMWISW